MSLEMLFSAIIGLIVGAAVSFLITNSVMNQSWQADAVAVGHAEYFMDPNGARKWRWKEQEK